MKAKKSLGQNFFVNQNLAKSIVEIILRTEPEVIVEIGPGRGYFSQLINKDFSKDLLLLEKDTALANDLQILIPKAEIKNIDFLDWDFEEIAKYKGKKILFFGSLPYNVSKKIIRKIIESDYFNSDCFFIIQKEVAEKYVEKEANILSVTTQLYANVKKEFDISPSSFNPRPKVNSSFSRFTPTQRVFDIDKREFISFLKIAFIQPRKTLRNNLRNFTFRGAEAIEELLSKRAQHLSLDDYIFLFSQIDRVLV